MTKRKGRKPDTRVTYTPKQTEHYKSQWIRYEKGLKIAREHVVHKISDEVYRIPSVRSPIGYWEISRVPDKGIINIKWQGKKPNEGIINVAWEGRKCRENPPPPTDSPSLTISGCNNSWGLLVGYLKKIVGYDASAGYMAIYEDCSLGEFISAYKDKYGVTNSTISGIIGAAGGSGGTRHLSFGRSYGIVSYQFSITEGSYSVPAYCLMIASDVSVENSVNNMQQILDEIGSDNSYKYYQPNGDGTVTLVTAKPEIFEIQPPAGNPEENCDLYDFRNNNSPDGGCGRGTPISWNCNYNLEENEFSYNWTKVSDNSIKNDRDYIKTIIHCPPPEPVGNIKIANINSVTSTKPDGGNPVSWDCNYNLEENEFSLLWDIVSKDSIKNENGYTKMLSPCTPPEELEDTKIIAINSVEPTEKGGYDCTCPDFSLKEDAFNPSVYPSMSQPRNWQGTRGGCPTWADGERRCCHVVAVQDVRGEVIPVPQDILSE